MTRLRRGETASASAGQGRAIVLLARAPSAPGKTRLTTGLTPERARALRTALLLDTLDVTRSAQVQLTVAYSPEDAHDEMAALIDDACLVMQRGADLGARMGNAIRHAFAAGSQHVVLIGSDVPTLPPGHVTQAFSLLEAGADCVFGPAADGGYYLVGVASARVCEAIFDGIAWGTPDVLGQSVVAARAGGLSVALASEWFDVDLPVDLERVTSDESTGRGPRLRAWLGMTRE